MVDPRTVGEYTGRGQGRAEIFEGDILEGTELDEYGSLLSHWTGIVYWNVEKCGFCVKDDSEDDYEIDDYDFDSVIGNIYDKA